MYFEQFISNLHLANAQLHNAQFNRSIKRT